MMKEQMIAPGLMSQRSRYRETLASGPVLRYRLKQRDGLVSAYKHSNLRLSGGCKRKNFNL
jgi:hypothetical protein